MRHDGGGRGLALRRAWFATRMHAAHLLGRIDRLPTRDRQLLEQTILPHYAARADVERVLFVGCAWYTRTYADLFPQATFITLEPNPRRARYGAAHHIVDGLERLDRYVSPGTLDLIVCNGVFGWGLDAHADCERAFDACHLALRPHGELVLGWNDVPAHKPCDPRTLASLRRFEPVRFAPADEASRWYAGTDNRHVFDFLRKPADAT